MYNLVIQIELVVKDSCGNKAAPTLQRTLWAGRGVLPTSSLLSNREKSTVESVQQHLNALESNVSSALLDRNFFKSLLDVVHEKADVTNDVIAKMKSLADKPYTLYLYRGDSLLYWSKPGLIIDPAFISGQTPPVVASDHLNEYLIKEYALYHDFQSYRAFAKIPILGSNISAHTFQIRSDADHYEGSQSWQQIKTQEGVVICSLHFLKENWGCGSKFCCSFSHCCLPRH